MYNQDIWRLSSQVPTVPDFKHLSRVPEGSATCLLLVTMGARHLRKTVGLIDYRFVDHGYTALEAESALVQHSSYLWLDLKALCHYIYR